MLGEDKTEEGPIVQPSQDANSWVKYAELDDKEMDKGLKEAKDLVERALQQAAEQEGEDIDDIRAALRLSADSVQRTFESFFTGMTDRLTSLSAVLEDCVDAVLDEIISKEVSREDVDKLEAAADSANVEAQAALIKGCGSAVVAQGSVKNEVKKLHKAVNGLEDAESAEGILKKFQGSTAEFAEGAMKEVKGARGTIQEQANKFVEEV
ncbi:MAG: hypothetical protein ACTJLL_02450, partial [Anaplasma sp.]